MAFYSSEEPALQQGDVLFAPIGRFEAGAAAGTARWATLDRIRQQIAASSADSPALSAVAGYAIVMVTTHECHVDVEFRKRVKQLQEAGVSTKDAMVEAEKDDQLDRYINVSPLLPFTAIPERTPSDLGAGRITGYFPVPALPRVGVFEGVIDLTYKGTIDRQAIVARLAVLTEEARTGLRYALARFEALRTPKLGFELQSIVGKGIEKVTSPSRNPLVVRLELSDGQVIELVIPPGSGPDATVARTSAPPARPAE